eukprot:6179992-Pleurochrysis_carterae.AAC.2
MFATPHNETISSDNIGLGRQSGSSQDVNQRTEGCLPWDAFLVLHIDPSAQIQRHLRGGGKAQDASRSEAQHGAKGSKSVEQRGG